ncbi:MAG: hypothetical protein JXA06_09680 [Bacteroidetes bacterium]|nr:hypothetical protein [Bacteroidota bacterium]
MKNRKSNIKRTSAQTEKIVVILIALILTSFNLMAQGYTNVATQNVMIEVKPIAKISVDGSPKPLIISENFSGSVSDDNTKYSLVTNVDNMKIVASIDNPMPAGTKLMVKLSSSRAASAGLVDLSNALTPLDVVRGIGRGSDVDQSISYTFAANQDIDEITQQSRTVTLTLTN